MADPDSPDSPQRPQRPPVPIGVGAVLVVLGLLWTGQGLGRIGGSSMSGVTFWAVAGPVVAVVGVVIIWRSLRRTR